MIVTELELNLLKSGLRARLKRRNDQKKRNILNERIEINKDENSINQLNNLYSKLEKCTI